MTSRLESIARSLLLLPSLLWLGMGHERRASAADRPYGPLHKTRSAVMARQGMAATSQPLATAAAIRVLQKGGNAVDAAIAANAVLGVVEPMSCGLGGDLFAIVWDARSGKLYGLNASGRSPAAANLALFREQGLKQIPEHGPLSWSVPGCVDGWDELRRKFGSRSWGELLEPAIQYAEHGFPVSEIIAGDWKAAAPALGEIPTSAACFLPGGHAPPAAAVFRNPQLARSLRMIAEGGRDVFYRGPLAAVDRELLAIGRRSVCADRFCRAHLDVGRAGVDQLPWLRYLGAASERAGYRGTPDAQSARELRSEASGLRFRRNAAPDDRGQEAGLRGSGTLLRRHGKSPCACQGADFQGLRGPAPGAD